MLDGRIEIVDLYKERNDVLEKFQIIEIPDYFQYLQRLANFLHLQIE